MKSYGHDARSQEDESMEENDGENCISTLQTISRSTAALPKQHDGSTKTKKSAKPLLVNGTNAQKDEDKKLDLSFVSMSSSNAAVAVSSGGSSAIMSSLPVHGAKKAKTEPVITIPTCISAGTSTVQISSPSVTSAMIQSSVISVAKIPASAGSSLLPMSPSISSSASKVYAGKSLIQTITTCYVCRQEFPNYESLKLHMANHVEDDEQAETQDKMVACGICDAKYAASAIGEHMKTHGVDSDDDVNANADKDEVRCGICMYVGTVTTIEDHMKEHEDGPVDDVDLIMCGLCDHQCPRSEMSNHIKTHNMVVESKDIDHLYIIGTKDDSYSPRKIYSCKKCDYQCSKRSRIRDHVQTCGQEKPQVGCEECGKLFKARRYLILHKKSCRGFEEQPPESGNTSNTSTSLKCHKCNSYTASKPSRLRDHLAVCGVTEQKFECDICGKLFKAKRYMASHRRNHEDVFNCSCTKCGYMTNRKGRLNEHMQSCFAEGKKYQCEICDSWFKVRKTLAAHRRNFHPGMDANLDGADANATGENSEHDNSGHNMNTSDDSSRLSAVAEVAEDLNLDLEELTKVFGIDTDDMDDKDKDDS